MPTSNYLFAVALLVGSAFVTQGQGITTPRLPSPGATVTQKIGISEVIINYSRPSVKAREVWGKLVPYGWNVQGFGAGNSAPWRAGANENTTITLSHDSKLQGKEVPAGTYGLFFVINEDNTGEVILSRDYRSWGSFFYDPANDVLRANVSIRNIPLVETLQYDFVNMDKNSAELVLNWEKKQFPVKIEFAVDQIVIANAVDELKGSTGFSWRGFSSAANYALQNDVELEQGLAWIDQAIAQNSSFATLSVKSGFLDKLGRTDEAKNLMDQAVEAGTQVELNNYGYQLLGQNKNDEAVKIFKLNTERFPKSANTWDSLGEGYVAQQENKKAIASFKRSLSLNPPANVKANSEKFLKQLGAK